MKSKKIVTEAQKTIITRFSYFILGLIFTFGLNEIKSFYSYKGVVPTFSITPSELKLEGNKYTKCYTCPDSLYKLHKELVIFNRGQDYLDFDRILNDRRLVFQFQGEIKNLTIEKVEKSRSNISIKAGVNQNSLTVDFIGDEALEEMEGIKLYLSYFGEPNLTYALENRIKGIPKGFEYLSYGHFKSHDLWKSYGYLVYMLIFLLVIALLVYQYDESFSEVGWILKWVCVMCLIALIGINFNNDRINGRIPNWAVQDLNYSLWEVREDCSEKIKLELIENGISICSK